MSGSFDWDGAGSPLGQDAAPIVVARYDGAGNFATLPNVVCEGIDVRKGSDPPVARFHYLLDVLTEFSGYPTAVEDLWPIEAVGPHVVKTDDRLVVVAYTPDGEPRYLFDGHVQVPQVDLSPGSVSIGFTAVGVAARCFDFPVGGRRQRDANDLDAGADGETDLPTRFNPVDHDGRMMTNCTPADHDVDQADPKIRFPVFVEERLERTPDNRRLWNLSGVVRYLLAFYNSAGEFVQNPDFEPLDKLLKVRYPKDESGEYDPDESSTYDEQEIPVREFDATNKTWPDAIQSLLGYSGFGFSWYLDADEDGLPRTGIDVYRLDQASERAPKAVWLDAIGEEIDPTKNIVEQLHLARDVNQVVNAWTVETGQKRIELSVVLAPGFTPLSGDETAATRSTFLKSKLDAASADTRRKYRWYVADEAADGHYDYATSAWKTDAPLDLASVFPPHKDDDAGDEDASAATRPGYVVRLRPGSNQIVSRDAMGRPYRSRLSYSQDYAGDVAAVWDGTGTWTDLGGGWRLLEDRLGIQVTIEDPEQWYAGKQAGELRGVTWQANPPTGKRFYLRLTTVIDDDWMLDSAVGKRLASPTQFERRRRVDARDHFRLEQVHKSSPHFDATKADGKDVQVVRDDTQLALDHANLLRAAHEVPPLAGSVVLPYCTDAYRIGDRIDRIAGREIALTANVGAEQGEAPYYPSVVAIGWSFAGDRQSTTLQLSDRRAEPQGA